MVAETSRVLRDPTAVAKDDSLVVCSTDYRGVRTNTRCIFQSYMPSAFRSRTCADAVFSDEIKCQFRNLSRREKESEPMMRKNVHNVQNLSVIFCLNSQYRSHRYINNDCNVRLQNFVISSPSSNLCNIIYKKSD